MADKTAFELWQECPRYQLPHEAAALRRAWWTTTQAARAWAVSPRTARRYFDEIGSTIVIAANVKTDRVRILRCVPAGTLRPPVRAGNPHFGDRAYQRELSQRRWDGHITRAQKAAFLKAYNDAAIQDVTEQAASFLPDEDAEDWTPYPLPEYGDEPDSDAYTEQWLRELMERKRRRLPRAVAAQD